MLAVLVLIHWFTEGTMNYQGEELVEWNLCLQFHCMCFSGIKITYVDKNVMI